MFQATNFGEILLAARVDTTVTRGQAQTNQLHRVQFVFISRHTYVVAQTCSCPPAMKMLASVPMRAHTADPQPCECQTKVSFIASSLIKPVSLECQEYKLQNEHAVCPTCEKKTKKQKFRLGQLCTDPVSPLSSCKEAASQSRVTSRVPWHPGDPVPVWKQNDVWLLGPASFSLFTDWK